MTPEEEIFRRGFILGLFGFRHDSESFVYLRGYRAGRFTKTTRIGVTRRNKVDELMHDAFNRKDTPQDETN